MASFKLVLRLDKQNRDGLSPVYLRITAERRSRYIHTEVYITPDQWDESRQRVRGHERREYLNDILERALYDAQDQAFRIKHVKKQRVTAGAIKEHVTGGGSTDVFGAIDEYIDFLAKHQRVSVWKQVRVLRKKVRDFHGPSPLEFDEVNRAFLSRFDLFMRNRLENGPATRKKNLDIFQRVFKRAAENGVIDGSTNPFSLIDKPKAPKPKRTKLPTESIRVIHELSLDPGSGLWHSRNYFLFSYYCGGLRIGDLCLLRWSNVANGRLEYRMAKTERLKSIKLTPPPLAILDMYRRAGAKPEDLVFPLLPPNPPLDPFALRQAISSQTTIVNRHLKELARLAEISAPISTHVARHSFADYARKAGVNLYEISKILGHSSLRMTEIYLNSFDEDAVDAAIDRLFPGEEP